MIANCEIALARACDAACIAALSRDAVERGLDWSWTPQRVLHSLRDADTNTIVARERDLLAGFAIMKYRDQQAHLLLMAVQPSRRRRGVGSALLDWLEVTVDVAGIASIRAEVRTVNVAARAFYRGHGYRERETLHGYYQGVDDAIVLMKELRS